MSTTEQKKTSLKPSLPRPDKVLKSLFDELKIVYATYKDKEEWSMFEDIILSTIGPDRILEKDLLTDILATFFDDDDDEITEEEEKDGN